MIEKVFRDQAWERQGRLRLGRHRHFGEGSIRLARNLGNDADSQSKDDFSIWEIRE